MYFDYGKIEINYLMKKDKKLARVIQQLGHINRVVDEDLFSAVIHHIVGQQISMKAQQTIWLRMKNKYDKLEPKILAKLTTTELQQIGLSFRKANYIIEFAQKEQNGTFKIDSIKEKTDEEAIKYLCQLKGIGIWTAQMILLFCLQRKDIFSFDDLAIKKGLKIIYHHKEITKELFNKYKRRFSPYGSVASLYLWAVANGALEKIKNEEKDNGKYDYII